jgi:hypothetical protein
MPASQGCSSRCLSVLAPRQLPLTPFNQHANIGSSFYVHRIVLPKDILCVLLTVHEVECT